MAEFQTVLMWFSLAAAVFLSVVGAVMWCRVRRLFPGRRELRAFRRLPWYAQFLLAVFVLQLIVHGSTKTNSGDCASSPLGTNLTNTASSGLRSSFLFGSGKDSASPLTDGTTISNLVVSNLNVRGAWDDTFRLAFAADWVFPFGTNHLGGVQVDTQGKVRPWWNATNAIASLGVPLAIVPGVTTFAAGWTANNSYLVSWTNGAANRDTNTLVTAAVELFRNGDTLVTTNGVVRFTPRVIPFPHDGFGQDDDWVRANFTNAEEILSIGYENWLDAQVGVGLTNGLYKFTATFPSAPPEATRLTVGDLFVCVTNAGDYVFLLEKGVEYTFNTAPYDVTVEYSMQDDVGSDAEVVYPAFSISHSPFSILSSWWGGADYGEWSVDSGWRWIDAPWIGWAGCCLWMPMLRGSPAVTHLGPDDFPMTFTAVLADFCRTNEPSFHWTCDNDNIHIASPYARSTEVHVDSLPSWDRVSFAVTAFIGNETLTSKLRTHYGTNETPRVYLQFNVPKVVVRREDNVDCQKIRPLLVSFSSDIETNGLLRLRCISGSEKFKLWTDINRSQQLGETEQMIVSESKSSVIAAYVEGVCASGSCDDIEFVAEFVPDIGPTLIISNTMTVASVVHETVSMTPSNRDRDNLGVGEEVVFYVYPEGVLGQMSASSGGVGDHLYGHKSFTAPGTGTVSTVSLDIGDLQGKVDFFVFEPMGYRVESIAASFYDIAGEAGLMRLDFDNRVIPEEVSFYAIEVMEIPMVATNAVGYFADPRRSDDLDHGKRGAGGWSGVGDNNYSSDIVQVGYYDKPWSGGGSYTWPIPNAWRLIRDEATTNVFSQYDQRFELDADGTARVWKFGYMGERTTNNQHRVVEQEMP